MGYTRGSRSARSGKRGWPTDRPSRRPSPCGLVTYPRLTLRRLSPGRDPLLSRCARAPRVTRKSVSSFRPATPPPSPLFSRFCVEIPLLFFWIKKRTFHIIFSRRTFFFCVCTNRLVWFSSFFCPFLAAHFQRFHEDRIRFGRNPSKKATTRRAAKKSSAFWRWRWCRRTAGVGGRGGGGKSLTRRASSSTETEHVRTGAT